MPSTALVVGHPAILYVGFVGLHAEVLDLRLLVLGRLEEQDFGEIAAPTKSAGVMSGQGPTKVETSLLVDVEICFHFQVVL